VGDGDGLSALEELANGELGRRVLLPGSCPPEEVADYLAAMDIAALSQSTDLVGAMRYTTKLPEYLAAGLPVIAGEIPAAYDLDTGWLWRLPGNAPWHERHIDALADLMRHVTREQIEAKKARVPRDLELFAKQRQQDQVCAFVREVTARASLERHD
jgi:glycosyltransferase involved in cell wall biosynthesis